MIELRVQGSQTRALGHLGVVTEVLEEHLTALDPDREHKTAFREKRWDGRVRLYTGNRFPSGFLRRVRKALQARGLQTRTTGDDKPQELPDFPRNYIPPHGAFTQYWDHQYEAALAMLKANRGLIRLPTAGGKTLLALGIAWFLWEELGYRTLLVTSRKGLARQTAQKFRDASQGDLRVGQCGDGIKDYEGAQIVVATAQTLDGAWPKEIRRKQGLRYTRVQRPGDEGLMDMINNFEVLILDECHHSSSTSWYRIAMASRARRRYGLSGTPLKDQELDDKRVIAATGDLLYNCEPQKLITAGLAARPRIVVVMSPNASGKDLPRKPYMVMVDGKPVIRYRSLPYAEGYMRGVVMNAYHNLAVIRATSWIFDRGRQTLLLTRRKDQWKILKRLLEEHGVQHVAIWGQTKTAERDEAKDLMTRRKAGVVLASTVWDEGEDISNVDAIVLAEGVQAMTNSLQRLGRGMRQGGRDVWIVDFAPMCHNTILSHALQRVKDYEADGHDVRIVTEWPAPSDIPTQNLLPFD